MSRIGREPVPFDSKVSITFEDGNVITVKGPKGELKRTFHQNMLFAKEEGQVLVTRPSDSNQNKALHGLSRSLLKNMVEGVTDGFTKVLELQGVGYRAQLQGSNLQVNVGFSHPVIVEPPAGIEFSIEASRITISGIDKELVGQVAANIRKIRPPEPYKGKGIRYVGEYVRRKAGKAGKVGV